MCEVFGPLRPRALEFPITLDARNSLPLHRQLYDALRAAIVDGRLPRGARLPSTRALAEALGVSRSTLTGTFAQLISEGYLQATVGSGTFVCAEMPGDSLTANRARAPEAGGGTIRLSAYGQSVARIEPLELPRASETIDFRDGRPAFDRFPYDAWRHCVARCLRGEAHAFDYRADPAGVPALRSALAGYLGRARAVACTVDDIIIVGGSQQALDLIARVTVERGDTVALEDPGYPGAGRIFVAGGADVRGIPVDADGLRVDQLERLRPRVRLVYVTPSHQFPLGAVLAYPRRLELLRWAQAREALVIEDDYDSAYRYEGRPIPSLHGLDTAGRTVYVGTFSKTMFPALRLGYLVVPRALRDAIVAAKALTDRQSPALEQRALATFIAEGSFERHLRRMRIVYRERRAALLDALERHIGERAQVIGEGAGMHLVVRFGGVVSDELEEQARRVGVALKSTRSQYLSTPREGEFIFGFAEHPPARIDDGISRLAQALRATTGR